MKRKHVISKSVSALIVAVLVITAFTREPLKVWLLIGAFAVWGIFLIVSALRRRKDARAEAREESEPYSNTEPPDGMDNGDAVTAAVTDGGMEVPQ